MSKEGVVRLKAQIQENPSQFAGMTQKQIAEMFGVGRRTVGDILAKYRVLYGLDYHNTHDGFQQAQEVEEKIFGGKLERDDEYFDVITRNKAFGISLTGEYWERYRIILAWKIKNGEHVDPPNWSSIFGFKTT